MKNLNIKSFVWVMLAVSIAAWGAILFLSGIQVRGAFVAIKKLPMVITIDTLLWFLFVKKGWKLKIFQNTLVPFPDLTGTWKGTILSTWNDPSTGQSPTPIEAYLAIHQSFLHIRCEVFTKEMTSHSYAAEFLIDSETSAKKLTYNYTSVPRATLRDRSAVHDGTALLEIVDRPRRTLKGEYWTNRKTTGEMNLAFVSKDLIQDFPE